VELTIEAIQQQSLVLREMLEKGEILIAGGMYDIETGAVTFS
jgi:carbonic anhydrase